MKITPKVVTRQVKVLRDPNPTFVSLVEHGAIQESFKVLKRAEPKGQDMTIKKRDATTKDSTSTAALTAGEPGVRKIVFHDSAYADEAAVKKYLTDNGYSDFTVTKGDNIFTAQGVGVTDDNFEKGSVKSVKMVGDGSVTGFVGKVAKIVEKTEKSEKSEQERAIKMDYWNMYSSDDDTVVGVIKDGMSDGIPPGFQEIISATAIAIGNTLKEAGSSRKSSIASIGSEFASLVNASADLYEKALDKSTKQTENVTKFIAQFREEVEAMITVKDKGDGDAEDANDGGADEGTEDANGKKKKPAKSKKELDDEAAAAAAAVQVPAPTGQVDAATLASLIGKAVSDGLTAGLKTVNTAIGDLSKKVDNVQTIAEDARNKSSKAAEEVSLVASQSPSKKSVPDQGNIKEQDDKAKKAETTRKEGENRFRTVLGMAR